MSSDPLLFPALQYCVMFLQPNVAYCTDCKTVGGTLKFFCNEQKQCDIKKLPQKSKLSQCCVMFLQPRVVYCSDCNIVDGTHFVRNLSSSYLAH